MRSGDRLPATSRSTRWDDIRSEQLHDTGVFCVDELSQSSTVGSNNSIGTIEQFFLFNVVELGQHDRLEPTIVQRRLNFVPIRDSAHISVFLPRNTSFEGASVGTESRSKTISRIH